MRYSSFKLRTKALAKKAGVKLSSLRETSAKALGFDDLHDLQKRLDEEGPQRPVTAAAEEISRHYGLEAELVLAYLDPTFTKPASSDPGQPLASFGLWDVYVDHLEHRRNGYWFDAERLLERTSHTPVELLDWLFHMVEKDKDMRDGFDQAFTFALRHLVPVAQQPDNELLSRSLEYFREHQAFNDAYDLEQNRLRVAKATKAALGIMTFDELVNEQMTILARLRARGIEEPKSFDGA